MISFAILLLLPGVSQGLRMFAFREHGYVRVLRLHGLGCGVLTFVRGMSPSKVFSFLLIHIVLFFSIVYGSDVAGTGRYIPLH